VEFHEARKKSRRSSLAMMMMMSLRRRIGVIPLQKTHTSNNNALLRRRNNKIASKRKRKVLARSSRKSISFFSFILFFSKIISAETSEISRADGLGNEMQSAVCIISPPPHDNENSKRFIIYKKCRSRHTRQMQMCSLKLRDGQKGALVDDT
jgi:hypothetical protein